MSAPWEVGRVLVYADNPLIARAAFKAAVEQYPNTRIRLRNRALVMEDRLWNPAACLCQPEAE
jgi:hypothetical protein